MKLLITVFAAVISTIIWYKKLPDNSMRTGTLALMYWGAALMWLVDAVFEYAELGAEYFTPALSDMINDAYLGLSVVALGLVIWIIAIIIKDPKGIIKRKLTDNSYN